MIVSIDVLYPVTLGSVAFMKTTEEPVFVLEIDSPTNLVTVRRAQQTDGGVKHIVEAFSLFEVESERAKFMRQLEFTEFTLEQRDAFTERRRNASMERPSITDKGFGELLPN